MPKLRKTLPKDFDALVKMNDFDALTKALQACDIDARGSYGKRAALHHNCSAMLTRWLVERGADLEAEDTWGNTPLHARITARGDIDVLLELGADIEHQSRSLGAPLHNAADGRFDAVKKLLERGAKVDAKNREGRTPLELSLARCSNAYLPEMVKIARVLIDAGAQITPACKTAVTKLGETFEFHRAGFAKDLLAGSSAALETLYEMFDVAPVARRITHDGKATITVASATWQQQHAELWNLLVPSSGACQTVQGEVVRIAGRIADELARNAGSNWDKDYRAMANAYLKHVATGTALSATDHAAAADVVGALPGLSCAFNELARLGVKWVLANPEPVQLETPAYRR